MFDCRSCQHKTWTIVSLLTVEPALFLVAMGYYLTSTATKVLYYDKVCIMMLHDVDLCVSRNFTSEEQQISVQQEVSVWRFFQIVSENLPAIFMNVVYANLVDRWSKKYTMLFCPAGYIISMIVYMIGAIFIDTSPVFILLGSLFVGISGGMLTMLSASFSYLSATTAEDNLTTRMSFAEASILAGSSISSFVSGILYDTLGYLYVYLIGIIINVLLAIYILVRLKNIPPMASDKEPTVPGNLPTQEPTEVPGFENVEEVTGHQPVDVAAVGTFKNNSFEDEGFHDADTDSISDSNAGSTDAISEPKVSSSRCACLSLQQTFKTLGMFVKDYVYTVARRREENKRRAIMAILSIVGLQLFCHYAIESLRYLFVSHAPLSWSNAIYGFYTGATSVVQFLCLLVILPAFKRLSVPSPKILIMSLVSMIFGQTVFALSLYTWMAFLSVVLNILQPAIIVTATSFLSSFVDNDEHGKAFGIVASIESLSSLLSSAIFNLGIYPATVGIFSGLAMLIAAMILVIPLAVAIYLHVFVRRMTRASQQFQVEHEII